MRPNRRQAAIGLGEPAGAKAAPVVQLEAAIGLGAADGCEERRRTRPSSAGSRLRADPLPGSRSLELLGHHPAGPGRSCWRRPSGRARAGPRGGCVARARPRRRWPRRWRSPPRSRAPRGRSRAPGPSRAWPRRSRGRRSRCRGRSAGRCASPASASSSRNSRQRRVVGWAPVPKARPGSTTTSIVALARLLPGGAQPEALADQERFVEVLPAVGPVVGDLGRDHLDQAVARRRLDLAQLRQLALAAVDRVLDVAGPALLLDPVGRQHGQLGEDDLGLLGRSSGPRGGSTEGSAHAGEEALVVALLGAQVARPRASRRASRPARAAPRRGRLGTITWMTIARSPGGPPFEPGRPWPRRANWVPCWIPGGSSISRSPSWLGILTLAPSIASTRGDLDRVDRGPGRASARAAPRSRRRRRRRPGRCPRPSRSRRRRAGSRPSAGPRGRSGRRPGAARGRRAPRRPPPPP